MEGQQQISVPRLPNYHPITSALINRLKDGKPGDKFTDEELQEIAGVDVSTGSKHCSYLYTAIRYCINHCRIVWQRVYRSGYILCLNSSEALSSSTNDLSRIRRRSNRAKKKLCSIKTEDLSGEEPKEYSVLMAQLSTINMFAGKRAKEKLIEYNEPKVPKLEDLSKLFG